MVDSDTQMKINALLDYAYDKTIERMNAIENAPLSNVYQTIGMIKGDYKSFLFAYINYYCGCLEGILFTRFLEEFDRMPSPSENAFIKESITSRFEDFKKFVMDAATKKFDEYEKNGYPQ